MKNLWKKIGLAVLAPVAFLTLAEGVARVVVEPQKGMLLFARLRANDGTLIWQRNPRSGSNEYPAYSETKPEGTVRVACVGGSTVEGMPFPELAFPVVLQRMLRLLKSGDSIEVIGCGAGGQYSAGEVRAFEEVLELDPDVVVLYSAHNEFHPANVARLTARAHHPVRAAIIECLAALRLTIGVKRLLGIDESPQPASSVRDDYIPIRPIDGPEYPLVLDEFRNNVEYIVRRCLELDIGVVLCTSVSNIRDFAPMADVFRVGLSETARARVAELIAEALEAESHGKPKEALELADAAAAIDDTPATIAFVRGRAHYALGNIAEAKRHLEFARDHDGRINRAPTDFNAAMREIADRTPALLADIEAGFAAVSKNGLIGRDWIVDNVHPTIEGQALIARLVLESMAQANNLVTAADLGRLPPMSSVTGQLSPAEEEERVGFANLLLALEKGHGGDTADLARLHFENSLRYAERAGPLLGVGLLDALDSRFDKAASLMKRSYALEPATFLKYAESSRKSPFVQGLFDACGVRFERGRATFVARP